MVRISAQTVKIAPGQQHAGDFRVDRQPRHFHTERQQLALFIDSTEFVQMAVAIADLPRRRVFDERKCSTSPSLSEAMRRITLASEERRDFRSVNAGGALKSSSSYSRTAMPSATRPQRPERWRALAWLIFSICNWVILARGL